MTDEPMHRLALPFDARGASGRISVEIRTNTQPASIGCAPEAAGFPVCQATVSSDLAGYSALLGWVQLVGTASTSLPERRFDIDPLQIFDGLDLPFAFYGIEPTLFDAPSRRDRRQTLDWLAHSFLCLSPTCPMDRTVHPVAAFQWGFRMQPGTITILTPEPLPLATWATHLQLLQQSFPSWEYS